MTVEERQKTDMQRVDDEEHMKSDEKIKFDTQTQTIGQSSDDSVDYLGAVLLPLSAE
ncbi:14847_t:CDS:2 [Acaulospora colombiana]|uniref:14847_t:CDS:1 n=1 Tax=Acaulospora colombiana TaxID=27376 RepID=A0ACA9KSY0_9GLOM|nr:14847_t:CDS:2 [Acaulospora colombiana]